MSSAVTQRRVARALRVGGPEVIEVGVEDLAPLEAGQVLVRVEAAGLNQAETLILSGKYVVRVPFPWAMGGEGAGTVVATGADVTLVPGDRVCWAAIPGSCADYIAARASMLARIPGRLSFEEAACLAVAGLTAEGLMRVWPLDQRSAAVVWGAAGAVGRMLVALLADRGVEVIGIASGGRVDAVRAAGAVLAIDREADDVVSAVNKYTNGEGAGAVFDPIGAATFQASLQLLAPRGCLINYGELSGPVPPIDLYELFPRSLFVTKYNGTRWVEGPHEYAPLIEHALDAATKRPAVISDIAGRFPLEHAADAYVALAKNPRGKILVLPRHDPA